MQSRNRLANILLPLLCGALAATAASADDVHLTNGKTFEGVIAVVTDSQVRIKMPGGEIRLPRSSVARVETADSSFAEFTRRKEALGKGAAAADWLGLARWSKANGFEPGVREAALKAADLDPHLPGIAPLLKPFGYVFDEQLDSFVPYAEAMRRKGFVQANGQWITREENAERVREREDREARRASQEAAEASRRVADTLVQIELSRAAQASQPVAGPYDGGFYLPPVALGYGAGFSYFGSGGSRGPHGHHGSHPGRSGGPWRQGRQEGPVGGAFVGGGYEQLMERQPGSLPIAPPAQGAPGHPVKRH
jgi:hypothetical protein